MPGTSLQAILVVLGNLLRSALVACACIGVMSRRAISAIASCPRHPQASAAEEFNRTTMHVTNREKKNRIIFDSSLGGLSGRNLLRSTRHWDGRLPKNNRVAG